MDSFRWGQKLRACVFVLLVAIRDALPVNTTTMGYHLLCTKNQCRNGLCYAVGTGIQCLCGTYFYGARCERIDMKGVQFDTIGNMVIFHWPTPPRLHGYAFVYYRTDKDDGVRKLEKLLIAIKENEHAVTLSNLNSNRASYRICIEDNYIANLAVRQGSIKFLRDCVNIRTSQDYLTLAGWSIAGILAIAAGLLMYSQKEKIEILYFNRAYKQVKKNKRTPISPSHDASSETT